MSKPRWGAMLCLALPLLAGSVGVPASRALAGSPVNQRVANLSDSGATIVWDTSASETGSISYGTSCGALTGSATTDLGNGQAHVVSLSGLSAATSYLYAITSGGQTDTNGGACYPFTTLPADPAPPAPLAAVGQVMGGGGCTTPVTSGIVTLIVSRSGAASQKLEAAINDTASGVPGTYALPFAAAAASDASGYFTPQTGDTLQVSVDTGVLQKTQTTTWNGSAPTVNLPSTCLTTPTAARVNSFSVQRQGGILLFRWQVARSLGITGFRLYAGSTRLTATVIPLHAGRIYSYRAHWSGRARFVLHVLLADGREVLIQAQERGA